MEDFWLDKRVLITGGAGYLGSALLHLLKDRPASVVRLIRPGSASIEAPGEDAGIRNIAADIREPAIWDDLVAEADVIFHLAAQTSAPKADKDPVEDMSINVLPMVSLLAACKRARSVPTVLFAGTATECGLVDDLPADETVADKPITTYDLHKLIAENYLKYYAREGAVHGATLRLANVYGPGPRSSSGDRGILNLMVRRALAGEALTVYGTGDCRRDYIFVDDVAKAFLTAAEKIKALNGGHFLIGSEVGYTVNEAFQLVADRAESQSGIKVPVVQVEPPKPLSPIDTRSFVASTSLMTGRTAWHAEVGLANGIDRTIEFYRKNPR